MEKESNAKYSSLLAHATDNIEHSHLHNFHFRFIDLLN